MASKEPQPDTTPTTSNAKTMMGRVWAVAELLAEAAQRETTASRPKHVSEKTQH
jgi:hypothetical protein